MSNPSSISRRIQACIFSVSARNYEDSMIHFFPALDKTAKRRRPKTGVGERIREFIADQEGIITSIATGSFIHNIKINDNTFPEAIYKSGRTSIAHEGELDPRLTFNDAAVLTIGSVWNLPLSYIIGLCVGVMVAPENAQESTKSSLVLTIFGNKFMADELWGAELRIRQIICDKFQSPNLFNRTP